MKRPDPAQLTRRERQIMDVVWELGQASAAEILEGLPDPPSYSAVRAHLANLESKGHLRHREKGLRYVFFPTVPRSKARASAVKRLIHTFFEGSAAEAVNTLLSLSEGDLSQEELDELASRIEEAKRKGR